MLLRWRRWMGEAFVYPDTVVRSPSSSGPYFEKGDGNIP